MENANERDDILFEQLKKAKRRKRRRIIITVVVLLLVLLAGGAAAVFYLRARVNSQFSASTAEVKSFQAITGQISANASGSGNLSYTDFEEVGIPSGVTVDEILVSAGDTLTAGDVIARVDTNSVMSALADVQTQLEELDDQISEAKGFRQQLCQHLRLRPGQAGIRPGGRQRDGCDDGARRAGHSLPGRTDDRHH